MHGAQRASPLVSRLKETAHTSFSPSSCSHLTLLSYIFIIFLSSWKTIFIRLFVTVLHALTFSHSLFFMFPGCGVRFVYPRSPSASSLALFMSLSTSLPPHLPSLLHISAPPFPFLPPLLHDPEDSSARR